MISLSSTADVLAALQRAKEVSLTAYTLSSGSVLAALTAAAHRGAHVRVRLEGYAYDDGGDVTETNERAITVLARAGADAKLVHETPDASDAMLHLKGAVIDGTLFLDDRNWPADGADTILRDTFARDVRSVNDALAGDGDEASASFPVRKRDALALEARLLDEARPGDEAIVETESFGDRNRVYRAIDAAAKRGVRVRLLVSRRDLARDARERHVIDRLRRDGVAMRGCDADEKFAVVSGTQAWVGSANATAAFDQPDQLDWGVRTADPRVVRHLTDAFNSRWGTASGASATG